MLQWKLFCCVKQSLFWYIWIIAFISEFWQISDEVAALNMDVIIYDLTVQYDWVSLATQPRERERELRGTIVTFDPTFTLRYTHSGYNVWQAGSLINGISYMLRHLISGSKPNLIESAYKDTCPFLISEIMLYSQHCILCIYEMNFDFDLLSYLVYCHFLLYKDETERNWNTIILSS